MRPASSSSSALADGAPLDAPARCRALEDLDTTLLVEAAAGSGKTTLLLGRLVALVRAGRARLSEIAAVTFTEKAAAELRMRLRAALEGAGLHAALRDLEAARIGTIHAFAASLLRERPVEAGVDPGFTVADPLTATLLLDATWERWLPESLSAPATGGSEGEPAADGASLHGAGGAPPPAPAPGVEAIRRAIELGVSLSSLRDLAYALVDERDRLDGLPGPAADPEPPAELDAGLRAEIARLQTLVTERARDPADRAVAAVLALADWARQTAALPEAERVHALLEGAPWPEKTTALGARTKWRDPASLQTCRDGLAAARVRVQAARAAARHNLVVGLCQWARGLVAAYEARKARAGSLDFHDLLLRARDLVRDRQDVRRDFQRQIRYLLVDEFQDTDPLQLEMILALAEGAPPGSLFIVGDPKQSIYRFRRADIETYEAAKATVGAAGDVLSVRANFRSDGVILDAVNRVFDGVMAPPPDGAYQPAYVPLEWGPATVAGLPPAVLAVPAPPPGPGAPGHAADDLVAEARAVAAYLRGEVEAQRLAYGDVAVLFRVMAGVTAYEDAFRDAGIPFRTVGGRHYYDRSEVGWVVACLSAIEDPHDPVALVGALRSPFFGLADPDLLALRQAGGELCYLRDFPADASPAARQAWALLRELHEARNALAPPALVERLYVRTQVVAAYALDPHGEARVANLLKVLDTARTLEATGVLTFRGFVRWLTARGAARYEEAESAVEGEDAVRLLTIHRAKGLEFPVVVVADLGREGSPGRRRLLVDRLTGRIEVSLGAIDDRPLVTQGWDAAEARDGARADAEALRLLYVAMTRAQRRLILPGPGSAGPRSFAAFLGPLLEAADPVAPPSPAATAAPPAAVVAPAPIESLASWRATREALLERASAPSIPVVQPSASTASGDGSHAARGRADGRRLGALVHAALAAVDLAHPEQATEIVRALATRQGTAPDLAAAALRRLQATLASPVIARARRAAWAAREVPVTAEVEGALVDGRVDLVFEEAGGLVVVEFKVEEDPDAAEQVRLYAAALARALGRPIREALVLPVLG